ncbi:MAG: hypothetical protein JM58_06360 [Peptococcaceae bacterium BICA1-8]|nr:MAG: hypothetical protein JM58_06360 [Peptococcaceae bacterium BICA1-8]
MQLPKIVKVRQILPRPKLEDPVSEAVEELKKLKLDDKISNGKVIAITGGSRGIANIDKIYKRVASYIKEIGGNPVIISAMGSHGGGTPEGQKEILAHLGVTEEEMGCPVIGSSDVELLGKTPTHSIDVYCAKEAVEADGVIVINRVKAHTAFRAPRESGLLKMLGIGLGRAPGADSIHSRGVEEIGDIILELSRVVRDQINVIAGLAIVENGYEETAVIEGLLPSQFDEEEARLLKYAKELMPAVPFEELDLLILDEMGKNYSGTGMDTNVIGRWRIHGVEEPDRPRYQRVAVLDLTEASHGNANGVGLADFTTRRLVDKIDYKSSYLNCLTTGFVLRGMIPVTMNSDKEVIESALKTLHFAEPEKAKICWIKNTLFLDEMYCSEALLPEINANKTLEVIEDLLEFRFDNKDNLIKE